jgi:3-hydroxyisobutyrate dehydrogenase-like beta-hydroxyacid dehydrogenase
MPRKHRKNVGLIGLGIIGSRVAAGLRAGGYHVFVWNRSPKAAPNFLGAPAEVAEICEIIQLFVSDAQAVIEVIEAFGEMLTDRHIVVNCSTIGPEATLEAAKLVQARGAAFLDAPFTGSKLAAEKAQLVYYVGGEESVYLRAKPVLEATSRAIVRCGKIGDAATLKIATNLLSAVTTQTLAEALAIVGRCGISPETLATAIEHNACKSGVIELKLPKMVAGDYEPHFSLKHMFKDVQLGIHLANSLDLEVPVTTVTAGVMYGALNNGWAELDYASVYKIYGDAASQEAMALPAAPVPEPAPAPAPVIAPAVVEAQFSEEKPRPPEPDAKVAENLEKEPINLVTADTVKIELPNSVPDAAKGGETKAGPGEEKSTGSAADTQGEASPSAPSEPVAAEAGAKTADEAPSEEGKIDGNGTLPEAAPTFRPMHFVRRFFSSAGK